MTIDDGKTMERAAATHVHENRSRYGWVIASLVAASLAAGIASIGYVTCWRDFQISSDALEYADVARNFGSGRGWITRSIWPNDLPVAPEPYDYPVHRSPLMSLLQLPTVLWWGTAPLAVLFPTLACYALLSAMVYAIANRLFDRLTALCATTLLLTNYNLLSAALSGYPTIPFALLLTAVLVGLATARPTRRNFALLGVLMGLGYLLRPNMLAIGVPVCLVAFAQRPRSLPRIGVLVIFAFLVAAPYLAMNRSETGSWFANSRKFVTLFDTAPFPGGAIHGQVDPPEPLVYFREHPDELLRKLLRNATAFPRTLWSSFRATGLFCVILGLAMVRVGPAGRLRAIFLAGLAGQLACDALTMPLSRFLLPFVPTGSLLGGAALASLLRWSWRWNRAAGSALGLLALASLLRGCAYAPAALRSEFGPNPHRVVARAARELARDPDTLIATDLWAAVTWYADQRTFGLPHDLAELRSAERLLGPIDWLIIAEPEKRDRWREALLEPSADQPYELVQVIEQNGRPVADIYRRRSDK